MNDITFVQLSCVLELTEADNYSLIISFFILRAIHYHICVEFIMITLWVDVLYRSLVVVLEDCSTVVANDKLPTSVG